MVGFRVEIHMTELKTLKNIEPELSFSGKEVREIGLRFSDMPKVEFIQRARDKKIREEAINHIKSMNSEIEAIKKVPEAYYKWKDAGSPYMPGQEVIRWIKWFFNITDEELK